jgi:hypothetical protein
MKKTLLFVVSFLICAFSFAQITLNQSNMPTIGIVAIENVDTLFTGITPGSSGVNQIWNFSSLANHNQDTSVFRTPSTLAGYSSFPTSNIGVASTGSQNLFGNSSSTSFDILGIYGDMGYGPMAIPLSPFKRMFTFPATYLTTYSGNYGFNLQIPFPNPPIDSARMVSSIDYVNTIDAWGTITTPSYSNQPCLRLKVREINTTTTYVHVIGFGWQPTGAPTVDTTFTYSWWTNTVNFSLAEIQTDVAGAVTDAKYLSSYLPLGVNENISVQNKVDVFPNPARTEIKVSGVSENCYLQIFDIEGKLVESSLLKNRLNEIQLNDINSGLYFYKIIDLKGGIISNGKFEVIK